jgi:DNA-directed RNA polymerase II subunit RPB3
MEITSNHLDIVVPGAWGSDSNQSEGEAGEELTKRGERFGHPVGKSASTVSSNFYFPNPVQQTIQILRLY